MPLPEMGTSREWLPQTSRQVTLYRPCNGPGLCGVKRIGTVRSLAALTGRPLVMLNCAWNGAPCVAPPDISADWLPSLVMSTQIFLVWPTRTGPKFTRAGTEANLVIGFRPVPLIVTVRVWPLLVVMANELSAAPIRVGVNSPCTGIASPGLTTVPTLGSPATV